MPRVHKSELLGVVHALWGSTGIIEDEAKLVLAEQLINEAWNEKKSGIPLNMAGQPIKAALGDRWLSSSERATAGRPLLRQVLAEDPFFVVRVEPGTASPMVKLRISRLSKLISNPEQLASEYRAPPGVSAGAEASSLTNDGLPIRPGRPECQHYLKHGTCLFRSDCWFTHTQGAPGNSSGSAAASRARDLTESELEPGVMLLHGVYPQRPGARPCAFYLKNGWCAFKSKCRQDHPPQRLQQGSGTHEAAAPRAGGASTSAPGAAEEPAFVMQQDEAPMVKQPPMQVLLGIIVDAVWPPRSCKEACAKGALAKWMLEQHTSDVEASLQDEAATISHQGPSAGMNLLRFWSSQSMYDPAARPYKTLSDLLAGDALFTMHNPPGGTTTVVLHVGQLISAGAMAAGDALTAMADAVWPPNSGKDAWLRGKLAKWLLTAGFQGNGGRVLRQVLTVGPGAPTVFRIDMAQAGEYLVRCWQTMAHPYDKRSHPWSQFKPLIAGDRFLYIEPAPGKPESQHVTLDLTDLLQQLPRIRAQGAFRGMLQQAAAQAANGGASPAAGGAAATGAGSSAGASSSHAAAGAAGTPGAQRDGMVTFDEDEEGGADAGSNALAALLQASRAAAAASAPAAAPPPHQQQPQQSQQPAPQQQHAHTPADSLGAARAELAALQALPHAPPPAGMGPRCMQRWTPRNRAEQPGWSWAEVAIRLLDPDAEDASLRLAEMVQHLELCPVMAVACATYKSHPHLMQFCAPHTSLGGLELPATVYLLDIMRPGPSVASIMELVRPVLASPINVKVVHSSKQWSGQLEKAFDARLVNYYDTQQAHYVFNLLRHELGRLSGAQAANIKNTQEVSLTALLKNFGLYHPVRHTESSRDAPRVWQDRPLSEELIMCAAADVAYLIPLMEMQVRALQGAAGEVRSSQPAGRSRAAALMSRLPPELSDAGVVSQLAAGVEGRDRGGLSFARLEQWSKLGIFHQAPLHDFNFRGVGFRR